MPQPLLGGALGSTLLLSHCPRLTQHILREGLQMSHLDEENNSGAAYTDAAPLTVIITFASFISICYLALSRKYSASQIRVLFTTASSRHGEFDFFSILRDGLSYWIPDLLGIHHVAQAGLELLSAYSSWYGGG